MLRRKTTLTGLITLFTLALGWLSTQPAQGVQGPQSGDIVVEECKIRWKDERLIASKIPGIVAEVFVAEGESVSPGDVLAQLDDRETQLQLKIQTMTADSNLEIDAAEVEENEYSIQSERDSKLWLEGVLTEDEKRLTQIRLELSTVRKNQAIEKKELETGRKELLELAVEDHIITSPMNGMIRKVVKRARETLTAGQDLTMFEIIDTDTLWVEADVPIEKLYKVRKGQAVVIELTGLDDRKPELPRGENGRFDGTIVFVDPNVDSVNRSFVVRAEVKNRNGILRSGLHARMIIPDKAAPAGNGVARRR